MKTIISILSGLCLLVFMSGCKGDDSDNPFELELTFNFDFANDEWTGDFADYPNDPGVEEFYELAFSHSTLPEPLNTSDGALRQSGNNHSDDLFMFVKRKLTGLEPNQNYTLDMEIEIASNAANGGIGIGGAPGESVYLKAGASDREPMKVLDVSDNQFRMNIDKGNQSVDGNDMKNIGDFANGTNDFIYAIKSLQMTSPLSVNANSDGEMWLIVGTDSGFEGTTTIYYNSIKINLRKSDD